jgi:hypothetical protein
VRPKEHHPESLFEGATRSEAHGLQVEVGFDSERQLVTVKAEGDLNERSSLHLARQFREAVLGCGWQRLVCDCRSARFSESVIGIYESSDRLQRERVPRGLRIAVIYENDEQKHRFWETVVRNRGFMARVFRTPKEATDWLIDPEG